MTFLGVFLTTFLGTLVTMGAGLWGVYSSLYNEISSMKATVGLDKDSYIYDDGKGMVLNFWFIMQN